MTRLTAALVAASALLLTGCAGAADPGATPTVPPAASPTTPTPTDAPATTAAPADAACETLIPAQTVTDFTDLGWVVQEEPFMVGATEVDGGLICKWGDPTGSGEGLQIFGWAPITATQSDVAQQQLIADGWELIDTEEGVFVTEALETAFATGDQGYGLTYQFGDGWIIFADTKQSLLLIERPQA